MYGYLTPVHTVLGGMQDVTLYLEQNYFWPCGSENCSTTEKTSRVGRETRWHCTDGGDSCHDDGAELIDGG